MSTINGSRLKILAMLFLFVPQESWDLQLRMFGYITCGFPRIFGYVLQVIKYSISVPLDRGGFGGWNLMLTNSAKGEKPYSNKAADDSRLNMREICTISYPVLLWRVIHNGGRREIVFINSLRINQNGCLLF